MAYPMDNLPTMNPPTVSAIDPLTCEERAIILCALREYLTLYKSFRVQDSETVKAIADTEAAINKIMQSHGGW